MYYFEGRLMCKVTGVDKLLAGKKNTTVVPKKPVR